MDSDRCDDTSSLLNYGLDIKPLKMVVASNSGPRHTIDNILGLPRKDDSHRDKSSLNNDESAVRLNNCGFSYERHNSEDCNDAS
ncbi:hypothetical protein HUJ05_007421 [Dendroctonus ponderosae]|nr:hypothetical protein HUJ05_007421 [Dendroctonus ponderosae]